MNIVEVIASELTISSDKVSAAMALLDEGATVPFIARYRKEATGGLDDTQLRILSERLVYLRELEDRRSTILEQIKAQGKLDDKLKAQILSAETKSRLEDLYLPYKPKRRTKAQIAIEAGLEPLALSLYESSDLNPDEEAQKFLNKDHKIETAKEALDGAKQILIERFSENADLLEKLRQFFRLHGSLISTVAKDQEEAGAKFKDYFDFQEAYQKVPSHRILAVLRGQKEKFLHANIDFEEEQRDMEAIELIAKHVNIIDEGRAADKWLQEVVNWTWKIKLKIKLSIELMMELRQKAEESAIDVFKDNLKNLLMTAPAGKKVTMGLDPGYRTGVKVVVVDDTGKLLAHVAIFPHQPQNQWDKSIHQLKALCEKFQVNLISIGNGTASRETDKLAGELLKSNPEIKAVKAIVSEAGASVYSASELAANEFPDLDVSYRGAVSIARRLQDPLAELVKIDPKAIGVGQYQHDVNQVKLARGLNYVLEDCVNTVGADLNTASMQLLTSISGLNETVARNIVSYREEHGRFNDRKDLLKVSYMGDKTYQMAVGFLRIIDGNNPLDASAVHPESYPIVDAILTKTGKSLKDLMGNDSMLQSLNSADFTTDSFGSATVRDIIQELKKPGRDPRPEFTTAKLTDGIETIKDLEVGMMLEGTVSNVTHFGAFVDIGVHQDGLVHVSELADKFVSNPQEIVKTGQIVKVRVKGVDLKMKRIELTMKKENTTQSQTKRSTRRVKKEESIQSGFGDILKKALNA